MRVDETPPPHNREAEAAILESILIHPPCLMRVDGIVSAEDFFVDEYRAVYLAMAALAEERMPIEPLTVKNEMVRVGRFNSLGAAVCVSSLLNGLPNIANVEHYAQIVAREAKRRRLLAIGNGMMRAAIDPAEDPDEIAAGALTELGKQATAPDNQVRPFVEVLSNAFDAQERRKAGELDEIALKSGYAGLDAVRAIKRSFSVIGSPSESGKTCHAINLWDGIASHGQPAAFLTLESTEDEVALRWATMRTGIGHGRMQDWRLIHDAGDFSRIATARTAAARAPLFISRRIRTVEQIYLECRRLKAQEGLDAVLIDYIQLVRTREAIRDREERFAYIAQTLLEIAVDLRIATIATSQVRDDWQKRDSGRLVKEDLKYARAIAETARSIMLFHRPRTLDKGNRDIKWCDVMYQIEKNSENKTDDPPMHMDEALQRFTDGDCAANNCRYARRDAQMVMS